MRRVFILMLLFVAAAASASGCHAVIPSKVEKSLTDSRAKQDSNANAQSLLPAPQGAVSDYAGVLDEKTKDRLEKTLTEFQERAKVELAVVTVKTTGERDIFDYSLAVANEWGIGASNSDKAGVLIFIAIDDRKWQIQITRSLEKVLPNEEVGQLGNLMNAPFRAKKYGEGISKCVDAFVKRLSERRGV